GGGRVRQLEGRLEGWRLWGRPRGKHVDRSGVAEPDDRDHHDAHDGDDEPTAEAGSAVGLAGTIEGALHSATLRAASRRVNVGPAATSSEPAMSSEPATS